MTYDIAILGLGYVGLPLAREAIRAGLSVTGVDVEPAVVAALAGGDENGVTSVPEAHRL